MSTSGENKEAEGLGPSSDLQRNTTSGSVAPEEVLAGRGGEVLLRHTILKSDHFPGCQNMKLTPLLEGAPNFRQVPDLPVYGVAIPTASGLRNVLDRIGASKGRKRVVWLNLREEPVIYINGKPFVVREADKPFANLEYTGIDRERVENMETRLKADVLVEAGLYGGAIMVAHEDDQFQVIEDWEPVTNVDVQTPAEVYAELKDDGYDVDYLRVPITDEKAPKDGDFESLIAKCWTPPAGAALVFNCQMGRGRTTTGMVIGCLLTLRKIRGMLAPPPRMISDGIPPWYISTGELPLSPLATAAAVGAKANFEEIELKHGMFAVVRSLLRALERGREAKACLDLVIDACSAMQNLREAINSYRMRLLYEPNDMRRQSILQVCLEYLDRYYSLITFAAYLDDPGFNPGGEVEDQITFAQWTAARPELRGILQRLLRSNPFNALALDQATSSLATREAELDRDGESLSVRTEEDEYEELLACRSGSVLGPHTILKQDHFPGCQSSRIPALFQGAPNFRGVDGKGIEVYGGAIATVDGVRQVLDYLGAAPGDGWKEGERLKEGSEEHNKDCRHAVWHMMREEPVVYINGLPYVLREERRPFKNLMEYRGIDAERLDQMEQRLRDDVIAESALHGGKILVSLEGELGQDGQETYHGPRQKYVTVQGPEAVETPRSVFEALQRIGYRVTFLRIPLTDGTCPRPTDFDAFYGAAVDAGANDALIYTCQLGGGRTTTGMAIGVLLRMHLNGSARLPQASDLQRRETLDRLDEDLGGGSPRGTSDDECEEDGSKDPTAGSEQNTTPKNEHSIDWETKNMEDGEYVAVRRFTRTLERGVEAKNKVDEVVDACGVLINLRTAIMRYRRPKTTEKFFRPEIQARHSAFQRGSAYLERYCMLIAFGAYLRLCHHQRQWQNTGVGVGSPFLSFQEWLSARPDVSSAREFIHQNPTSALAPVPPVLPFSTNTTNMASNPVGMTPMPPSTAGKGHISAEEQRQVLFRRKGSTIGRRTILKSFTVPQLSLLGMGEEAVKMNRLSVEGVTDICKAIDKPVFTVGNATVLGLRQLLSHLGARPGGNTHVVVTDVREELVLYVNGTAYLRRELEMPAAALHHAGIQSAKLEDLERRLRADMITEAMNWGGRVLLHREVEEDHNALPADSKGMDDITRTTEYQPRTKVTAFWEWTGDMGDIDMGMCTPLEVFVGLAAEGFQLSYRRVPLSRERTPQALDLDHLHLQMRSIPGGKEAVFMFISRTATGSSTRFAAAFACCILNSQSEISMSTMKDKDANEASPLSPPTSKRLKQSNALFRHDSDASDLERSVLAGEYRGVMNLCRVLPGGAEAKAAVDQAIDACKSIGNLRLDILKCKEAANQEVGGPGSSSAAARHLGLHYLQRYFFLIAFRAFLDSDGDGVFSEWVSQRPEINYLLSTLDLE